MSDFQLTTKQIASLKALHRTQQYKRLACRINVAILLGSGWSVAEV